MQELIKFNRTLRMTPPMAAGIGSRLWDVADLVALLEAKKQVPTAYFGGDESHAGA